MKVTASLPLPEGDALQVIHTLADNAVNTLNKPKNNLKKPGAKPKPAIKLILPWPDKRLSPNARIHWASRAKAVKSARHIAFSLAQQAGWNRDYLKINLYSIEYLTRRYDLILDFYPPNKHKRDDDNLIAAFKPYRDGIAQALNIDDFRFRTVATIHQEVIKNGQVHLGIGINHFAL